MAELAGTFRRPFAEQVAAFRLRLADLRPTATWMDVWQAEHDRAFMVAGAIKADLLADLAGAVQKAIEEGTSLEQFRADFREIVTRRGWHGWTGEGTKRGEAWRTRVIYKTNMATSYAAGRWAQLRAAGYPLLIYRHGGSLDPRLEHLGWDGLILPADHSFWLTHAPPNGWGCSCYIVGARSERDAVRKGGKPQKKLPDGWAVISPKTGAPAGIDRGWAYAPGASVAEAVSQQAQKLESLPRALSVALINAGVQSKAFEAWFGNPVGNWPVARVQNEVAEAVGSNMTVAKLSAETLAKQKREHPELTLADYMLLQMVVDNATHRVKDGDRSVVLVLDDPAGFLLVLKATTSGSELFVTSFRRMSGNPAERARLIKRLQKREVL